VNRNTFWRDVKDALAFFQPFSDFIHQVEADRPALARVHCGILELQKHVKATGQKWEIDRKHEGIADLMVRTFERRLTGCSGLARLYQPAFAAAYVLDPLYGNIKSDEHVDAPELSDAHETVVRALIARVGGVQAVTEFNDFVLTGWKGNAAQLAANCARTLIADVETVVAGSKRKRKEVASVDQRACVWRKKGATVWPELTKVALKLLSMHPTSASTERNWSLWGRVYTAARNALSLERARKMITFCFNSRAQTASMEDFDLLLDTIEQGIAL
jgi:hypothetical protein